MYFTRIEVLAISHKVWRLVVALLDRFKSHELILGGGLFIGELIVLFVNQVRQVVPESDNAGSVVLLSQSD